MRTILCFGDSNTHGTIALKTLGPSSRLAKAQRWPSVMAAELGPAVDVIAEGHPGRTAAVDDPIEGAHKNGLTALPVALESHKPIDLLILMLGTNDTKARFGLTATDIALALVRLGALAQSSACWSSTGPKMLFLSPVPIMETGPLAEIFAGGAAKSRDLADRLQRIASSQHARFLDLAQVAEVDPTDGVHLSSDAHKAIGHAVAATVTEMLSDDR